MKRTTSFPYQITWEDISKGLKVETNPTTKEKVIVRKPSEKRKKEK